MDASAVKVIDLSNSALFASLADPAFFEKRLVVTVELTAVSERLGNRWPQRKEQVWEHLSRAISRRLRGEEVYERATETAFIVVLMRATRQEAIAIACHALQDTLHFFLGNSVDEDIRIREVVGLIDTDISCRGIKFSEIQEAAAAWAEKSPEVSNAPLRQSSVVSIHTATGRRLDVRLALQRITRLQADRPPVLRASPTVTDPETGARLACEERRALDFGDIAAIDTAVLTLARGMWEADPAFGPIMVPLSFYTLSRTTARSKLLSRAGIVPAEAQAALICEMIDVSKGVPTGRIREVLGIMSRFSRGVFVESQEPTALAAELAGCRIMGLTFDASEWEEERAAALVKKLFVFAESGRPFARALIAHSLAFPQLLDICKVAGLSHAAKRAAAISAVVRINDAGIRPAA